ncbi:MAG: shikimate dehydrogenase [bacterium]|jgi:fatty aldehyde-generating acyl-ACP reductase
MERFAFLLHPLDVSNIYQKIPWLQALPDTVVESVFRLTPPAVLSHITGIESSYAQAEGWFVNVPLTSRQMVTMPEEIVLKKIIQAGKRAEQLGAKIIGLGAFTAVVGDAGLTVAKNLHIAVTTGNSYTVGTALEGIKLAADKMGIDFKEAEVLVVGANGAIGSACARILARQVKYLTLVSRNGHRLENLARRILRESGLAVRVANDLKAALRRADVVLTVTGSFMPIIEPGDLKPGAVVCDVARPRDVSLKVAKARPDVLVIEGGIVQVPGQVNFGFDFGFPSGTSYACMAETMILTLEGRFENFTLGRDLTVDQIDDIMRLADKHGFRLAGLRSFERALEEDEVRAIRQRAGQTA